MSTARISKPCKTAMQSGKAQTKSWLLEYVASNQKVDDIMGWTSSSDMYASEVKLHFPTKEAAIAYAEANGIAYDLVEPKPERKARLRAYTTVYRD